MKGHDIVLNDLISVVVPVYNVEKYLSRCLESILNQTYQNIEILLINDGSTDKSEIICNNYKNIDDRIKVINKINGGLSDARNTGILNANGKYICFVDSDDYIHPEFISRMYYLMIEMDAQIVSCNMLKFSKYPVQLKNDNSDFEIYNNIEAIKSSLYEKKIDNSVCNKLFDINLFNDIKFPVGKYFEDLATTYKLFLKSNKIIHLNTFLYFYYQNSQSIMHTYNEKKIDDLFDISVNLKNDLTQFPNLSDALNARLINIYFYICRESFNKYKINDCYKKIKSLRKKVFKDKNISLKTRIGIICSFFGIKFTNFIFDIYRKVLL